MSQYCPKHNSKEIIYDQSTDCDHYKPVNDAPAWVNKPRNIMTESDNKDGLMWTDALIRDLISHV